MTGYSLPALRLARDAVPRALDLPLARRPQDRGRPLTLAFQTAGRGRGHDRLHRKAQAGVQGWVSARTAHRSSPPVAERTTCVERQRQCIPAPPQRGRSMGGEVDDPALRPARCAAAAVARGAAAARQRPRPGRDEIAPRAAGYDRTGEFPWDNIHGDQRARPQRDVRARGLWRRRALLCRLSRLRARDLRRLRLDRHHLGDQFPRDEAADRFRHRGAEAAPAAARRRGRARRAGDHRARCRLRRDRT